MACLMSGHFPGMHLAFEEQHTAASELYSRNVFPYNTGHQQQTIQWLIHGGDRVALSRIKTKITKYIFAIFFSSVTRGHWQTFSSRSAGRFYLPCLILCANEGKYFWIHWESDIKYLYVAWDSACQKCGMNTLCTLWINRSLNTSLRLPTQTHVPGAHCMSEEAAAARLTVASAPRAYNWTAIFCLLPLRNHLKRRRTPFY